MFGRCAFRLTMNMLQRSTNDPWFMALVGVFMVMVALAGVWHSLRAGVAQCYYHAARYGKAGSDTEQVLELCRRAYVLYPENYYFSILAAEKAYYTAGAVEPGARKRRMDQAAVWCDRGLVQNGWKGQLRRLKVRFLWEQSPSEAIRFWRVFTDWQFWEPYNHAELAAMYAQVGDFTNAEREMKWISGTSDGARVRQGIDKEQKEWTEILEDGKGWGE